MPCRRTGLWETAALLSALVIVMQPSAARPESLDELCEQAKPEGALVLYPGVGPAAAKAAAEAFREALPGHRPACRRFRAPLRERLS